MQGIFQGKEKYFQLCFYFIIIHQHWRSKERKLHMNTHFINHRHTTLITGKSICNWNSVIIQINLPLFLLYMVHMHSIQWRVLTALTHTHTHTFEFHCKKRSLRIRYSVLLPNTTDVLLGMCETSGITIIYSAACFSYVSHH